MKANGKVNGKRPRVFVDLEAFVDAWNRATSVDAWNRATSVDDVATKFGITRTSAMQRACALRKLEVPMKRFTGQRGKMTANQIGRLKAIARKAMHESTMASKPA